MRDSALELSDSIEDIQSEAAQGRLTVMDYYRAVLARRGYTSDESQLAAVNRLQQLYDEWGDYKERRNTALKRFFVKPPLPRGVYLWGGVGRGKSFLMDSFYLCVPLTKKRRVHFHHFMRDVHRELDELKGQEDPLMIVAERIGERYRLICFDEFHVNDIADAMILGRLLKGLFENRVMLTMTSNYHPDLLWKDGLQRQRFVPAIGLIKEHLDIINVDAGVDYRRRALEQIKVYHSPLGEAAEAELKAEFERIAEVSDEDQALDVEGREIAYRRRAGGIVWFDFAELCGGPRSYADYVDLAKRFHTVVVSNMSKMGPQDASAARRFTWLIDVFYDSRVKLILSAAVPAPELYEKGLMVHEFTRTLSRLEEMQSVEYLRQPRVAQESIRDAAPDTHAA
jgi:cell division protein ZapE